MIPKLKLTLVRVLLGAACAFVFFGILMGAFNFFGWTNVAIFFFSLSIISWLVFAAALLTKMVKNYLSLVKKATEFVRSFFK